jgi:nitrous oxidase accessory protein NosD
MNSNDSLIYGNDFVNNHVQVSTNSNSTWDDDYPTGGNYWSNYQGVDMRYRDFPSDLVANVWGYGWAEGGRMMMKAPGGRGAVDALMVADAMPMTAAAAPAPASPPMELAKAEAEADLHRRSRLPAHSKPSCGSCVPR